MLKFKLILLFILFFPFIPFTSLMGKEVNSDSLLLEERAYYYNKYRSVRDTMTINTWLNLKRVSDNLEQVVKRDQQVIDILKQRILSDSALIDDLKVLSVQNEKLFTQKKDIENKNILEVFSGAYLKAAVVVLLIICLILIYFLVSRYSVIKKLRIGLDHYASKAVEKNQQLELADAELRRVKQRELDFRDELEKGMQLNQERLLSLQDKCVQLEDENKQLRNRRKTSSEIKVNSHPDLTFSSELPDNVEELRQMTRSLLDERNSLINLAGKLRTQNEEETKKNHEIIRKINFLLNDLSENKEQ